MQIISGQARGVTLAVPPTMAVRPTAGRSRKALFDSLGRFDGATVVDLFSGSGALGLEAASRGAATVVLVESDRRHCRVIERNIQAVRKTGVVADIRLAEAPAPAIRFWGGAVPDVVFADPPYEESAEHWRRLVHDNAFLRVAAGALLVWEIPDAPGASGAFLADNPLAEGRLRRFGGTGFLIGYLPEAADVQG